MAWPVRSPDLTIPDFFLWGYLKSRVYANKPQTIAALKENIRQECEQLSPEILRSHGKCDKTGTNVYQHWRQPLDGYHLFHLTEKIVKVQIKISITQNHFFYLVKKLFKNKIGWLNLRHLVLSVFDFMYSVLHIKKIFPEQWAFQKKLSKFCALK